jgi:hypothetical protein
MKRGTCLALTAIATVLILDQRAPAAENTTTELSIPLHNSHGEEMKQLQATSTESVNFAPGGLIRISGSYGELTVEGWDQSTVEVQLKKSLSYGYNKEDQKRFDAVKVATERHSEAELSITTVAPSPNRFVHPFTGKGDGVSLEYEIRVPRNSRLVIQHGGGTVTVSDVVGDVDATAGHGDIMLWLRGAGPYAIDAKSRMGLVSSDFAGDPKLLFYRIGERFDSPDATSAPHIHLRIGFGGITIKQLPKESEAVAASPAK